MSTTLQRIGNGGGYAAIDHENPFQNAIIQRKGAFQRQLNPRTISTFAYNLIYSCCSGTYNLITNNRVSIRIYNNITWVTGGAHKVASKANEIPYFITHPKLIINLCRRQRVKDAITNLAPVQIKTTLSQVLPAHPIEGNLPAVKKNKARIVELTKYKGQFNTLFTYRRPITEEFIEGIMPSTSPMQIAFDNNSGKYIAFSGNSRLIALKTFCSKEFPNYDPEIEINIHYVDQHLIDNCFHFS